MVRATNDSPKLGKLWVWGPICSNLFSCGHGPKPTIYWVWGSICAFRGLFPCQTGQKMSISIPPSSRLNKNWTCHEFDHVRANEEIMFFCISENLKIEEIIFVISPSPFLRHCGYFLGTEAHIFANSGNEKKLTKCKKRVFFANFQPVSYTHLTLPTNREV